MKFKAQLLAVLLLHAEDHITQHLELVLRILPTPCARTRGGRGQQRVASVGPRRSALSAVNPRPQQAQGLVGSCRCPVALGLRGA